MIEWWHFITFVTICELSKPFFPTTITSGIDSVQNGMHVAHIQHLRIEGVRVPVPALCSNLLVHPPFSQRHAMAEKTTA